MKKKILSILLSLFLAVTVFTVNAFADDVTVGNLLNTVDDGFPTTETDGWICQYGTAAYLDTDNLIIVDPATSQNISIPTSTVLTQDGNNHKCVKDQSFEVLFEMNNNKLIQFTTTSTVTIEQQTITIILTYKIFGNRMTMSDLFSNYGEDFPTEEEDAWINTSRSTSKMYLDNNTLYIFDIEESGMSIPLMLVLDVLELNTKYSLSMSGISIDFIIDDGQLNKVVVNSYPGLEYLEGTYIAPLTIADILDTVEGGYPVAPDEQTVPDGCFTTDDGYRLYYIPDKTELVITDTPFFSIDPTQKVALDTDGNYITTVIRDTPIGDVAINVKLVMSNNKLQRIEADAPDIETSYVFKPLGNRTTLAKLFEPLQNKPDSLATSWVNENNKHFYIDEDGYLALYESDLSLILYSCLNPTGNNFSGPSLIDGIVESNITAIMENGTLKKVKIDVSDAKIDEAIINCGLPEQYINEFKEGIQQARGTYSAPVTILSILPNDFPTDDLGGLVNSNGKKAYIGQDSNLHIGSLIVSLNNQVTKEGDNYSYTIPLSPNPKILFNMSSGKVSTIEVTGSSTADDNGVYDVYKFKHNEIVKPIGYKGDIVFTTNAKYVDGSTTVDVLIDGVSIQSSNYTVTSGSTIITLLSDYVQTLSSGSHSITIKMTGYADITQEFKFANTPSGGGGSSGHAILNTGVK